MRHLRHVQGFRGMGSERLRPHLEVKKGLSRSACTCRSALHMLACADLRPARRPADARDSPGPSSPGGALSSFHPAPVRLQQRPCRASRAYCAPCVRPFTARPRPASAPWIPAQQVGRTLANAVDAWRRARGRARLRRRRPPRHCRPPLPRPSTPRLARQTMACGGSASPPRLKGRLPRSRSSATQSRCLPPPRPWQLPRLQAPAAGRARRASRRGPWGHQRLPGGQASWHSRALAARLPRQRGAMEGVWWREGTWRAHACRACRRCTLAGTQTLAAMRLWGRRSPHRPATPTRVAALPASAAAAARAAVLTRRPPRRLQAPLRRRSSRETHRGARTAPHSPERLRSRRQPTHVCCPVWSGWLLSLRM